MHSDERVAQDRLEQNVEWGEAAEASAAVTRIRQDAPTVCMMLPNKEASEARQKNTNTRNSNGASVALRHRSSGDGASCS
jgi:hypothetical protein